MSKSINISESDIVKMVSESVKKTLAEINETAQLKNAIRRMVNETLDSLYGVGGPVAIANAQPAGGESTVDEKFDSAHDIRKSIRHSSREFDKKNGEKKEKGMGRVSKQRRSEVLNWLKEPELDCAEIMRKLWHPSPKHEDSARSYFYKCRDGKLNDSGVPYRFSDKEINALYRIKSETAA